MTKESRQCAIEHINNQLKSGYIDLGAHDQDEIEVIKEAMQVLEFVDAFNNIPNVLYIDKTNKENKDE